MSASSADNTPYDIRANRAGGDDSARPNSGMQRPGYARR